MMHSVPALATIIFVAGFLENFISAWETKAIAKGNRLSSGISGFVFVLVWYLVLSNIVKNLDSQAWVLLVLSYATGSGVGNVVLVHFFHRKDKITRKKKCELALSDNN